MTLFFHYNANKFSLQNKKFAGNCVAEVGCAYNEINDTVYECAVLEDVEQIFANMDVATILATLADQMYEWSDYMPVDSKNALMSLIDKTLAYYGENIATYFDKDDWDDYIVMLLEAKEVLGKTYISDDDLKHFSTSLWEDREL
jgi:hypothetical protein